MMLVAKGAGAQLRLNDRDCRRDVSRRRRHRHGLGSERDDVGGLQSSESTHPMNLPATLATLRAGVGAP
jgi:hypothetical protein